MKSGGYSLVRDIKGSESKIPPAEQTKLLNHSGIQKSFFKQILLKRVLHITRVNGDYIKSHTTTIINKNLEKQILYRVSEKTWEFSDEFDIVFVMN